MADTIALEAIVLADVRVQLSRWAPGDYNLVAKSRSVKPVSRVRFAANHPSSCAGEANGAACKAVKS